MSAASLSRRDRRVLATGAAIVLGILIVGRGGPVFLSYVDARRASAANVAQRAARTEWLVLNAGTLHRELGRVRGRLARLDSALLDGDTPTVASATLAAIVSDAVADTDARLASIRLSVDTVGKPSELSRVVAHASITGDLFSIAAVLQTLEAGPQLLAVSELSIATTQPGIAPTQTEHLQVELTVDGLYRREPRAR
jgi:hypothetical protein